MTLEPSQITKDALASLGSQMRGRDQTIIDEFSDEADLLLVGSEAGEIVRGKAALAEFFRLFGDGVAIHSGDAADTHKPYRLAGVLVHENGKWRWRMFHGSEPVTNID